MRFTAPLEHKHNSKDGGLRGVKASRSKRRGASTSGSHRVAVSLGRMRWADFDPAWWQGSGIRVRTPFLGRGFWSAFAIPEDHGDPTLPCGLKEEEVLDLMYRDIKPEDFETLSKLDETVPKRDIAERRLVDDLPKVKLQPGDADECGVCLAKLEKNVQVSKLPCQHFFHPECIEKWLTQCKNSCPLCSSPISAAAKGEAFAGGGHTKGSATPLVAA